MDYGWRYKGEVGWMKYERLKEFILERGFPILIITFLFAFFVMWLYVIFVPRQYHYIDLDGVEHIDNCIHTRASTLQCNGKMINTKAFWEE